MKNNAVLIGIHEGMFTIDLPQYVVEALSKRKTACKLHVMKSGDKYEYFINSRKVELSQTQK